MASVSAGHISDTDPTGKEWVRGSNPRSPDQESRALPTEPPAFHVKRRSVLCSVTDVRVKWSLKWLGHSHLFHSSYNKYNIISSIISTLRWNTLWLGSHLGGLSKGQTAQIQHTVYPVYLTLVYCRLVGRLMVSSDFNSDLSMPRN